MKPKDLLDMIGEADDGFVRGARISAVTARRRRFLKPPAIIAACLALAIGGAFILLRSEKPLKLPKESDAAAQTTRPSVSAESRPIRARLNEIEPTRGLTNDIAVFSDDFVPMSREEALEYFGTEPFVSELFPETEQKEGRFGVYRRKGGKGEIYWDLTTFSRRIPGSGAEINVTLSKARLGFVGDIEIRPEGEPKFTPVNGRRLAIFHYTGADGKSVLSTEWLQDGVAWRISSSGLSDDDFLRLLRRAVKTTDPPPETDIDGISGKVVLIDPVARRVGIRSADDDKYVVTICLPKSVNIEDLTLFDNAKATWRGGFATLLTVWEEQLVSFEKL